MRAISSVWAWRRKLSLTPVEWVQWSNFFPEWRSTIKQWFGKSADPWVSSLWQQCPGARHPLCSGFNKELGWRLELEHAKKQCTSSDLPDLWTPPPPLSFTASLPLVLFFSCVSWFLPQNEWGTLFSIKMQLTATSCHEFAPVYVAFLFFKTFL